METASFCHNTIMDVASFESAVSSNTLDSPQQPDPVRLQALVDDYNKLMDECRLNVEKRREAIKRRWEEKRYQAVVWRDYQLESAQTLYEAEVEGVEREFEEERSRLKDKLITELLEERKRLMDELEPTLSTPLPISSSTSVNIAAASTNTTSMKRSLRKRNAPDEASNPSAAATTSSNGSAPNQSGLKTLSGRDSSRRRTTASPFDQLGRMGIETRLAEEEIYDDINTMYREDGKRRTAPRNAALKGDREPASEPAISTTPDRRASAIASRSAKERSSGPKGPTAMISGVGESLIDASVSDSVLTLQNGKYIFRTGDPVTVLVTQSDSTFNGTVSTIGANELWIRREDGTKNKIYLGQLRIGKYKLAPPGDTF